MTQTRVEFKIIADHLRSSCFLIADGVMPSNEGRGYVLRRIMRRAMRQIHKLGAKEATMHKLVDSLIKEMGTAYPELVRARDVIIESLKNEEERFRETLGKGLKILEEEIIKNKSNKFSGETAFKLYDTYGFPLDLTQDILKEKNIQVDEEAFNREMELQRQRARKNWSGSGEEAEGDLFLKIKNNLKQGTDFLGYNSAKESAKILKIIKNGKEVDILEKISEKPTNTQNIVIILDKTPFYATSGGQKGDDGQFISNNGDNIASISEAKKFAGNLFGHLICENHSISEMKIGDEIIAQINIKNRELRSANHSATHLMHKALKETLGNSISQKGSNVDAQYFTFDFNFNRAMNPEEIKKVEDIVNSNIKQNSSVSTNLMPLEKARETGAEALFGEKYEDEVRVVKMGSSVELCGGTHVENTSEIENFKIISEKSVASGIRRIEAKTSSGLRKYLSEQEEALKSQILEICAKITNKNQEISELTGSKQEDSHNSESDLKTLTEILKQKDKEVERLKKQDLLSGLNNLKSEKIGEINLLSHAFDGIDAKDLREIANSLKSKSEFANSHVFALFGSKDGKVPAIIALSNDLLDKFDSSTLIRPVVEAIGGKGGGGKKDLAMGGGSNEQKIPHAIDILKDLIS